MFIKFLETMTMNENKVTCTIIPINSRFEYSDKITFSYLFQLPFPISSPFFAKKVYSSEFILYMVGTFFTFDISNFYLTRTVGRSQGRAA